MPLEPFQPSYSPYPSDNLDSLKRLLESFDSRLIVIESYLQMLDVEALALHVQKQVEEGIALGLAKLMRESVQ